ncbi:endo-1,4-beta-xylanase [Hymenobacter elongatus]|uniref:Beta-xylanase n=1 Tax=Hymenobacter elongatus TaxID=877208 RepID=A0A4Z0PGB2_9BACT|nr:endo-1,4-beta-xylanase [Hymenobacter elongatus]TGE13842.1 endo-1,4-beta-xylanase [Hymenobacter elongatus]
MLLAVLSLASCQKDSPGQCDAAQSLYARYPFPIGVAINMDELAPDTPYQDIATRQFNGVTPENVFKASYIHPAPGSYDWEQADQLVAFCRAYNKRLHGHPLIWHQQLPRWMENFSGTEQEWEALFREHIQTLCRHFRGRVRSWDVVNEAFAADGTLRHTIWQQHLGSGYLEKAFRYAHEADPTALLFYNEYDLDANPVKRRAVLAWLRSMQQRGVPIHGLGLQTHMSIVHPENTQIAEMLREVQPTGLQLHLSEVDVALNPLGKPIEPTPELLRRQADKLAFLVRAYQELPRAQQYGITFWGISDRNTWIRRYFHRDDYPLLFDDDYQPKPAYCILARP